MRRFKKLGLTLLLSVSCMAAMTGCGKKEEEATTTEAAEVTTEATTEATTEDPNHPGQVKSPLTGEWIDKKYANQRPITVMINNLKPAVPQSGIEKADIMYEILVEGGITRMLGVYTDYADMAKIGPIRSARHYYVKVSMEYDALFVHCGHSKPAVTELARSGIDHIDGTEGIGSVFGFRTSDRKAPHNYYASSDGIMKAFEKEGFTLTHHDTYDASKFAFNENDTELAEGDVANKITTQFNKSRRSWFEYDATEKLYRRFEYSNPQIDEATGEQLKYKNVIIQFATHSVLDPELDLQEIKLTGKGDGWYATDGKIIPITWEKPTDGGVTKYYTADGNQLMMNPGKTWITLFKDTQKEDITIEQ